jgi:putative nucleotidyltransferase with HDIG domain
MQTPTTAAPPALEQVATRALRRFARDREPQLETRRFARAFDPRLFPALWQSRDRVLELMGGNQPDLAAVVSAVESDPGLTLTVLRAANLSSKRRGRAVASVSHAISVLSPGELEAAARAVPVFGLFGLGAVQDSRAEEFRLHALETQRVAAHLRARTGVGTREELVVSSLLHDVGKLALLDAHERFGEICSLPGTPGQRLALERRHLGLDHATAGSLVVRRLGLPSRLAAVIERHHADDAHGDAAVIRLADMVAHYVSGHPVNRAELTNAAQALELDMADLAEILFSLPSQGGGRTPRVTPSPLSRRQAEILAGLAEGKLYKQIGQDLGLADSTVRSHVNIAYRKLGVNDRAQAVLLATARGWLP